jgi:hypothetical protein
MMMMVKKKKKTQPFKLHVYSNYMNVLQLKKMNQQTNIYPYIGQTKKNARKCDCMRHHTSLAVF